jgi:hypothetical protein
MSAITKAQRARLGIFVAVAASVLVVLVAIPLGLRLTQKDKSYFAYFSGESMSGLEQGFLLVKYPEFPTTRKTSHGSWWCLRCKRAFP